MSLSGTPKIPDGLSRTGISGYKAILDHSFEMEKLYSDNEITKFRYLSDSIFQFVTYDSEVAESIAKRAIEVCGAITLKTTFEYIRDPHRYEWFIAMCNMPFFSERITWGSSIRGAWWEASSYSSTGLWINSDQVSGEISFTAEEWNRFCRAIIEFSKDDEV